MQLKDQVKQLAQLQEVDKEIYQLSLRKDETIPERISELKKEITKKEEDFAALKEKINRAELEKKNKEGELAEKEEKLKKAKIQLHQLKSNKEYQIKLNEIASIKADISCAEDEVLNNLEIIEQEKDNIEKERKAVDNQVGEIKQAIDELAKEVKEIEHKIDTLKNKRKHYTEGIEDKILGQYQSLLEKRSGLAIVPVKNNNCGACYMTLTHQKINEIKMYDKLVLCESCIRVLYIPEDLELCV